MTTEEPSRSSFTPTLGRNPAKRMKADGHTGKDIAKYLGVSRATLYRYQASERAAKAPYSPGVDR